MLTNRLRLSRLHWMYAQALLLAMTGSLLAYVNSSFLQTFIDVRLVGTVFTVSYILTFFAMGDISRLVSIAGPRASLRYLLILIIACLVGLATLTNPLALLVVFVLFLVLLALVWMNFDIVLEHYSKDAETGRIRGLYLSFANLGVFISPVLAGAVLDRFGFSVLFLLSAAMAVPIMLSFTINFRDVDTLYKKQKKKKIPKNNNRIVFAAIKKNKNIRFIFFSFVSLALFYSIMVIYTPLHLLNLGFDWAQIGTMITIALIPFFTMQYIFGYLADRYFGEQEMLILGFLIMGLATMMLFFVSGFWPFTLLLFITRIGASLIEIMAFTYFYKQIDDEDVDLISLFRRGGPLGYIIGPLLASITLYFFDMRFLFLFLGFLMILAVAFPYKIKDTR